MHDGPISGIVGPCNNGCLSLNIMQNMGKYTHMCHFGPNRFDICLLCGFGCPKKAENKQKGTAKRRIDNKTGQTTYPAPHVDSRPISGLPEDILEFRDLALSDRWKQTTFVGTEIMRWETNEMYYTDALAWYWDLIMHSSDALVAYDFEAYEFYEEWRKAIKGGMLNA